MATKRERNAKQIGDLRSHGVKQVEAEQVRGGDTKKTTTCRAGRDPVKYFEVKMKEVLISG